MIEEMLNGRKERFKKHFKRDFRLLGEQKKKKRIIFLLFSQRRKYIGRFSVLIYWEKYDILCKKEDLQWQRMSFTLILKLGEIPTE